MIKETLAYISDLTDHETGSYFRLRAITTKNGDIVVFKMSGTEKPTAVFITASQKSKIDLSEVEQFKPDILKSIE